MPPVTDTATDAHPSLTLVERPLPDHTACLVHIHPTGPSLGRRYPLAAAAVLGRDDGCEVVVDDPSASRRHARLVPAPGGYSVTDLGSTNGTFVNEHRVTGPTPVRDGDNLRVGNCVYRFLARGNVEADYHEQLYRLTVHDGLTGLSNRRALTEFLDREAARSRRHGRPLSVLLLDVDHFKAVNDRHGHPAGDAVLRELAARLRPAFRQEDLLARYGGEEFVVALVETPHDAAVRVAERVRRAIADRPVRVAAAELPVTVSVGVATTAGAPGLPPADLLRVADARLYEAKQAGRNRVSGEQGCAADRGDTPTEPLRTRRPAPPPTVEQVFPGGLPRPGS